MLNICAVTNVNAGLPPCNFTNDEKRASMPIATKANANHTVRKPFKDGAILLTVAGAIKKENTNEAAIKPNTNLGKRSQTMPKLGLSVFANTEPSPPFGFL